MQTAALFYHDDAGRITGTNDGESPGVAPRLFLGRTRKGNVWRFRDDLPDELAGDLNDILESEPTTRDLHQPPTTLSRARDTLAKVGAEERLDMGPAYRFPNEIPEATGIVMIDRSNIDLIKKSFPDHYQRLGAEYLIRRPIRAIIRQGAAVSICYCARRTFEVAEAGVDTAQEFQGQGLGTSVTAAWAASIRRIGRVPLYSTSWDNTASQRVAVKLGLIMYGADLSIT